MWGHLRACNHTLDSPACFKQRLTVAAWTPKAGGLAAQSVSILFQVCVSCRRLGPGTCLAHSYKEASPLVESPRWDAPPSELLVRLTLRTPVSFAVSAVSSRTLMKNAAERAPSDTG